MIDKLKSDVEYLQTKTHIKVNDTKLKQII